jgi:hypothetical protein
MREIADSLTATIEQALPVLKAVREEDAAKPALAGGWSRKQVVGHLIDSASNNHQRFVRAGLAGGSNGGLRPKRLRRIQPMIRRHAMLEIWSG